MLSRRDLIGAGPLQVRPRKHGTPIAPMHGAIRESLWSSRAAHVVGHLKDSQSPGSRNGSGKLLGFGADPGPAARLQEAEANRQVAGLERGAVAFGYINAITNL